MKISRQAGGALSAFAACALILAGPAMAQNRDRDRDRDHKHDDDNTAAAVVAGLALAGVVAAVASHKDHDRDRYDRDGRRYYDNRWGDSFRPEGTNNTICYTRERACYKKGQFSQKWTVREFGYDRRR